MNVVKLHGPYPASWLVDWFPASLDQSEWYVAAAFNLNSQFYKPVRGKNCLLPVFLPHGRSQTDLTDILISFLKIQRNAPTPSVWPSVSDEGLKRCTSNHCRCNQPISVHACLVPIPIIIIVPKWWIELSGEPLSWLNTAVRSVENVLFWCIN